MILPRLGAVLALLLASAPSFAAAPFANSPSAFLRSQAGSPVDWQPWDAALAKRAKEENRAVYVYIGSFLSELSRATTRQTFANKEIAAYLNKNFICVLVDRDEQPDVAAAALDYLRTCKQLDGWPAHVWLTPEMQPYEGAGYLPPSEEWGKPGFLKVAGQARDAWVSDPKSCRLRAVDAVSLMKSPGDFGGGNGGANVATLLDDSAAAWRATLDAANGGFGASPKNLEPELLRFLLGRKGDDREAALATLRAEIRGAVHDPLDGGFFPRATDAAWRLPYFQKTLTDQARLALACLDARGSDDARFAAAARDALDYALGRLAQTGGGFAAAEDATPDETAAYYTWTAADIDAALGRDAAAFKAAYGVQAEGNVSAEDDPSAHLKGRNILHRVTPFGDPAAEPALRASATKLRAVRDQRPAPARNDRATAGAHGLMLAALSRAQEQLGDARFAKAAADTFAFIQKEFIASADADLRRMRTPSGPAAPADYAAVALGCREFGRVAKNSAADALADRLLARANVLFLDQANGNFFATPADNPSGLFVRPPAAGDAPAAETLALLAGEPPPVAAALLKGLKANLDPAGQPSGDILLALGRQM